MQAPVDYVLPKEKKEKMYPSKAKRRQEIEDRKNQTAHQKVFLDTDQAGDDIL